MDETSSSDQPERKPRAKRRSPKAKPQPALPPASSPPSSSGLKVQVFYLAARNTNPKAPVKDALWFAAYPIIPRVGDCLFHDGVYYQVSRVFLYENMAPGWYADVEVTFYGRR
ncbi:hypothetical protein [Leptolyngbya sp. PCC 6406]|uniref:hypothetical protein n=1 Tax=Leptolyngbya sp. PCC 6406 TaxID=1173264 RepID=UPI0002ACE120|nr:hypothetical protein [Leptolyngbya sp. PCC 6406]